MLFLLNEVMLLPSCGKNFDDDYWWLSLIIIFNDDYVDYEIMMWIIWLFHDDELLIYGCIDLTMQWGVNEGIYYTMV